MTSEPTDYRDDPGNASEFPEIVDDVDPERAGWPDPQLPTLPGDDYMGVDQFGTTVEEQIEGESLDRKLDREMPEEYVDPLAPPPRGDSEEALAYEDRMLSDREGMDPGRIVEADEGAHTDLEKDAVGYEVSGGENADYSPEESAMHIQPEV